ncbi:MAG: nickel pincer cofactor biosynthesis protein LarB [Candidatus Hydrogenedentes bacterium]|nr:nickel pincer cofactor biosynthesis protein LarB [Candidatus Hydrogenedentota bacterium]
MDTSRLKSLLSEVALGNVAIEEALERLRNLPFEDLGFAKVDHHRMLRKGYPETIFCAGKTPEQVVAIVNRMREHGSNVLGTRCAPEVIAAVTSAFSDAVYHEAARAFTITVEPPEPLDGYIAIVCAGTSDIPVAEEAAVTCAALGNRVERVYDVGVAGIHRLFGQREKLDGAHVVIVCAGMEGALPSVIGGLVERPIIAVPTSIGYGTSFGGLSALLGMLNSCATGLTVVNIDNGFGAAVAASAINRLASKKQGT